MTAAGRVSLAADPELGPLEEILPADLSILVLPPGTAPPAGERLWAAGIVAWAAAGEDWLPSGRLPIAREPGEGPWISAPQERRRGAFRKSPLAAPHDWSTAALAAFLALGRGTVLPLEKEEGRLAAAREGECAAAIVLEKKSLPSGWWSFDLAAWWKETALTPLVLGLLWKRPGIRPPEGLPPALPAHREGIRQVLEGAAELGLVDSALEEKFTPRAWRTGTPAQGNT